MAKNSAKPPAKVMGALELPSLPLDLQPSTDFVSAAKQTGQKTAKVAAQLLTELGFVVPTAKEREALLIAFVRAGYVIYGKAFDVLRCSTEIDLSSSDDILAKIDTVTLFEVKSTNKPSVKESFRGYFFSLSTAELLVAQNLGERYRFAFVNTITRAHEELTLLDVFKRARAIYPTWSIQF